MSRVPKVGRHGSMQKCKRKRKAKKASFQMAHEPVSSLFPPAPPPSLTACPHAQPPTLLPLPQRAEGREGRQDRIECQVGNRMPRCFKGKFLCQRRFSRVVGMLFHVTRSAHAQKVGKIVECLEECLHFLLPGHYQTNAHY